MNTFRRVSAVAGVVGLTLGWASAQQKPLEQPKDIQPAARQDNTKPAADARSQKDIVQQLLRDFAKAVQENNVEAALKCFPSDEDFKAIMPEGAAAKSATELRSHIKLQFAEFVNAYKEFGKCDLVELDPGQIRQIRRGEQGIQIETMVVEGGHISFAKDANYFIELRFNVGAILRVKPDRWVITSLVTRIERFPTIDTSGG